MLRKLKWQIPGEPLAARCNWCQGSIPGRGLAVERHWRRRWASCWNQRCENRRVPDLMNVVDGVKAFGFISWNCMTVWRAAWRHIAGTCRRTTNRGVLFVIAGLKQWRTEKGGLGCSGCSNPPPPKFWRYRWSPRLHEQEEPASRFPFVVHCVLIQL